MSDILDDILVSSPTPALSDDDESVSRLSDYDSALLRPPPGGPSRTFNSKKPAISGNPFLEKPQSRPNHELSLDVLTFDENSRPPAPAEYDQDMDWQPTGSQHRAFSTFNPVEDKNNFSKRGFGQAPVEADRGPFWYKVPPAPQSMAKRVLNPSNTPRMLQSNTPPKPQFSFRGPEATTDSDEPKGTEFAQPRLLPTQPNDPRNSLSDLFGNSFSLSAGQTDQRGNATPPGAGAAPSSRGTAAANLAVLVACLASWLYAPSVAEGDMQPALQAGAACGCVLVGARAAGAAVLRCKEAKTGGRVVLAWVASMELLNACLIAFRVAVGDGGKVWGMDWWTGGVYVMGWMILHQVAEVVLGDLA
jgi:hypothetical protein